MLAVASGLTGDRVTLTDVAEHAGVSAAAASLALRGLAGVAESTRQRVRAAAVDLGYRGRGSATEQLTIGLLMKARPHEVGAANAFYGPVMAGITAAAAALAVDVRLDSLPVDEHYDPIEVPRLLDAPGIDGLLVLGAYLSAESARMLGMRPVVLVDGYAEDRRHFATVITDNLDGAHQATQRLIDLGHRRIAMVGSAPDAFPSILDRRAGYQRAMAAAGLPTRFVDGHHDEPGDVAERFLAALRSDPQITGVVAANDDIAVTIIGELGARVPAEVSVIGFDDIATASKIRPRLDTVAVDKAAMGRLAVAMLLHRVNHPRDPSFTAVQPVELVVRESAARRPPPR